jgi:uncharacterized membrane protein HdeD (DUF308 family)
MESAIKNHLRHWWMFLLRGLLFVFLGIYMFNAPMRSYVALSLLFGILVLIAGVIELIHAFSNRHSRSWLWHLVVGVIDLVLGIILVSNVTVSMSVLPFVLGVWFLVRGISLFTFASAVRKSFWVIAGGILTVLFALLIMFNPAFGAMTIVVWTALAFIVAGIFNGLLAFRLKAANDFLSEHRS